MFSGRRITFMSYNKCFHQPGKEPTGVDRFSGKKIHAKSAIFTKKKKAKANNSNPHNPLAERSWLFPFSFCAIIFNVLFTQFGGFVLGLRTPTRSFCRTQKFFFWTLIELLDFIRKISELLKRNKRSLIKIVCCSIITTTLTISMVLNSWGIVLNLLHEWNISIFLIAWAPAVKINQFYLPSNLKLTMRNVGNCYTPKRFLGKKQQKHLEVSCLLTWQYTNEKKTSRNTPYLSKKKKTVWQKHSSIQNQIWMRSQFFFNWLIFITNFTNQTRA